MNKSSCSAHHICNCLDRRLTLLSILLSSARESLISIEYKLLRSQRPGGSIPEEAKIASDAIKQIDKFYSEEIYK